jgi:type I restriction enzyme M protein
VQPQDVKSYLEAADVLISAIGFGSIGKVGVVEESGKYTTVPEVIVVRTSRLNPFVLQTYLSSAIGQAQLERPITGSTGQLHLFPWQVARIVVPIPDDDLQQKIAELHIQARTAKRLSRDLLEQARRKVEDMVAGEAVHA